MAVWIFNVYLKGPTPPAPSPPPIAVKDGRNGGGRAGDKASSYSENSTGGRRQKCAYFICQYLMCAQNSSRVRSCIFLHPTLCYPPLLIVLTSLPPLLQFTTRRKRRDPPPVRSRRVQMARLREHLRGLRTVFEVSAPLPVT